MANINLLPWREELRQERNKTTMVICAALIGLALLMVFCAKVFMDSRIDHQNDRNSFIEKETKKLAEIIKEIEDIKQRRDALRARMDVIQELQQNRAKIVHVFDDLVNQLPDGVYFDEVKKNNETISISGKAQSNNRVSLLMRGLDASDWFEGSSLKVVDVLDQSGVSVSQFDMAVKEEKGESDSDDIEDVLN